MAEENIRKIEHIMELAAPHNNQLETEVVIGIISSLAPLVAAGMAIIYIPALAYEDQCDIRYLSFKSA